MGFLSGITSFVKEHSEVIHGVLDVAGFIPGLGAVADLANAGLYAAEGDYLNAGLSLVSAIPGIGDTVALAKKSVNAIKGGLKSLKGIKNINALKKAKGIKKALAGMRGKAKTGASRLKKGKVKKKGKLEPPDEAIDAIKKDQKKKCLKDRCFTGDTLVYTSQGYKPIKEIRKGDEVYSRDEKTGETSLKEVVEVFCTTAHTIYHIWVDGKEEFKTTAYHPVYVQEQGWVTAINLRGGDTIETMAGLVHITKVEKTRHEEAVPVYNFHVKDWVSYFVGTAMVYVHNSPGEHLEGLEYKNGSKMPEITTNSKGELTNGIYTLNQQDMIIHVDGKHPNKSQFLYNVDANKAVLDASAYADINNLWKASSGNPVDFANKAKVPVINGYVGVTGKGELTNYINVYRTKTGYIHGCPGNI